MEQKIKKRVTHAGAVILRKNGGKIEVLLTKRVGGKVPGFFLTQGHIEEGESHEEAAQREIIEETRILNAVLTGDLGVLTRKGMTNEGKWYRKTIHFFLFRVPVGDESQWQVSSPDDKTFQLQFVPKEEANSYLFFKEEKKLLESVTNDF